MMNNELLELLGFLNSELLWVYVIAIMIGFYLITSLLTWSIKKPLMYLGIPSVIVGILLMIMPIFPSIFIPKGNVLTVIETAIKPLLMNGVICIIIGISMIVVYNILNTVQKKKQEIVETEVQMKI